MKYFKVGAIIGFNGEVNPKDIVEAVQFTGVNRFLIDLKRMIGPKIADVRFVPGKNVLLIADPENPDVDKYMVSYLDYIMLMEGEIVPVKPFIFEAKFKPLDVQ